MLRTRICDLLGIRFPIFSAPLGPSIAGPELTAAVSGAGGLGIMSWGARPPELLRQAIRRVRDLTAAPFGVNVIVPFGQDDQIAVCLEERVPVLSFSFGDPAAWIERARAAGTRVVQQVGSVADARRSARAGADVVIAQGVEAGGHLAGAVATPCSSRASSTRSAPRRSRPRAASRMRAGSWPRSRSAQTPSSSARASSRPPEAEAHPDYKARVVAASETTR
jgi:NAD(P)H-dependent flavin oxidoreductase YrpB (nitropropane dioxygenase family)